MRTSKFQPDMFANSPVTFRHYRDEGDIAAMLAVHAGCREADRVDPFSVCYRVPNMGLEDYARDVALSLSGSALQQPYKTRLFLQPTRFNRMILKIVVQTQSGWNRENCTAAFPFVYGVYTEDRYTGSDGKTLDGR